MKAKTVQVKRKVTPETVTNWADQVERGIVVTTDLNDGSFEALMAELERRGYSFTARSAAEQELRPFLFRVKKGNHASQ